MRRGLPGFLAVLLSGTATFAETDFRSFETDAMRVVYFTDEPAYILPHLGRAFENSLRFHRALFDYEPNEPVTVLLQDFDDYGFAGASAIPTNYLTIGIEPFEYVYETSPTNERIHWVMSHELLHIVASDQAAPADRFWRNVFGGKVAATDEAPLSMVWSYLTAPRVYAPRWYHEGLAVFLETWMAGGYGRALGGYDEMVFRSRVAEGAPFWDVVGLESEGRTIDFQLGQVSYLYGTRFVCWLALHHGPESVLRWLSRKPGTARSFRSQFERVYGMPLAEAWQAWIDWEHEWQRTNLERVRTYPVTPDRPLSPRALGSVSRAYHDESTGRLYTAVNYPGEFAHIAAVDVEAGRVERIAEVATPALFYVSSLAFNPDDRTMFYTTDNARGWRDLRVADVDGGSTRLLIENLRAGDLAWDRHGRAVWAVQHHNGLSRLIRVAEPWNAWELAEEVLRLDYGRDLFDIDVSPDGKWLTGSMIEVSGRQQLIRVSIDDLLSGTSPIEVLHEFPDYSPANFVHSPDGRFLYGTSYTTGVSNVFRYDFERSEMEALTNGETGYFRPVPIDEDEMVAFRYTAEGFLPVRLAIEPIEDIEAIRFLGQAIVNQHPVVKEWELGSPAAIDLDALEPKRGPYHRLKHLEFASVYPIVEGYRGQGAAGVRASFMEPAGLASLDMSLSASPAGVDDDETLHAGARLAAWPWELTATANRADFYDLFGPTETSRKGYSLGLGYNGILIGKRPRELAYGFRLVGWNGLDTVPAHQNVAATSDDYVTASAKLTYRHLRRTIGGLDPEKGLEWELHASDNYAEADHAPRLWAGIGRGFPLPLEHSSIWLRGSAGNSFGNRENVFGNFFFGAFGNNYVDHGSVHRYREHTSFPGLDIDEAGGKNFAKAMVEWALPPKRFRSAGTTALYLTWARLNLFTSALRTDIDRSEPARTLGNVGAQLDLKLVIFSNLSTTLSFGWATAFEEDREPSDEVMASLKIL